jgi:hypothetical protein
MLALQALAQHEGVLRADRDDQRRPEREARAGGGQHVRRCHGLAGAAVESWRLGSAR